MCERQLFRLLAKPARMILDQETSGSFLRDMAICCKVLDPTRPTSYWALMTGISANLEHFRSQTGSATPPPACLRRTSGYLRPHSLIFQKPKFTLFLAKFPR